MDAFAQAKTDVIEMVMAAAGADSFNAVFGENQANWQFVLHCSEEES